MHLEPPWRVAGAAIAALASVGLAACNWILGVDDLTPIDAASPDAASPDAAPGGRVTGRSQNSHLLPDGTLAMGDEDLSAHVFQAHVRDDGAPGGYRVLDGISGRDGTFSIDGVPDGPYYLRQVSPVGAPTFYVTDARELDLGMVVVGRPDAAETDRATPLTLSVTGMVPWLHGDDLVLTSFSTGTQLVPFGPGMGLNPLQEGARGLDHLTVDWWWALAQLGSARALDPSRGDDFHVAHTTPRIAIDDRGDPMTVELLTDLFTTRDATVANGAPASVSGAFTRLAKDRELFMDIDLASFERGYPDGDAYRSNELVVEVRTSPGAAYGSDFGPPLVRLVSRLGNEPRVDPNRFSHRGLHRVGVIPYANPFPSSWNLVVHSRYTRRHQFRVPGATRSMGFTEVATSAELLSSNRAYVSLQIAPPGHLAIDGADALKGGAVAFTGDAPVRLSWDPDPNGWTVDTVVQVYRLYLDEDDATGAEQVADVRTTDTFVDIPPSVLVVGGLYSFRVIARSYGAANPRKELRRTSLPYYETALRTGLFRLSARCGNGTGDDGEECDTGGASASCDADCSMPLCGDGLLNTEAQEICDSGGIEALDCTADCKVPVCGDGKRNGREDCDDGNRDEADGCSSACMRTSVCGDGVVQAAFEACDDGDGDPLDACVVCRTATCGDGFVRTGVEECDDGNTRDGDGCSAACRPE